VLDRIILCALVVAALTPGPAAAQDVARYQQAIDHALQEFEGGRWEEARAFFRQAHREIPNPRTLRGIAMASYELRDYPEAYRSVRAALEFGPSDRDLTPEHRAAAQQLLDRVRALLAIVEGVPPGAVVRLDGTPARVEPNATIIVTLGSHVLGATHPNGRSGEQRLDVAGGETIPWAIDLGQARAVITPIQPPPPTQPPPPAQPPPPTQPPPATRPPPVMQPPPPMEPVDLGPPIPRFRFHFFGLVGAGGFESAGTRVGVVSGGALAGLLQVAEVYAIGVQLAGSYASLAEANSRSDSAYWGQFDALLWNELRFGPFAIGVGLGGVVGAREASTFPGGVRSVGTRVDGAFGLVTDVRIYYADGYLFVAGQGRFAFGDYGEMAGVLAFGVEPVR
jgi:hypothetical protein